MNLISRRHEIFEKLESNIDLLMLYIDLDVILIVSSG